MKPRKERRESGLFLEKKKNEDNDGNEFKLYCRKQYYVNGKELRKKIFLRYNQKNML